jgi:hypothetical protein
MNDINSIPIACALTDDEFREREQAVLQKFRQQVIETRELDDGYAYRINNDDDSLREITELVLLERICCPFLDFKIIVAAADGGLWLEMIGAKGAKEFIAATFK